MKSSSKILFSALTVVIFALCITAFSASAVSNENVVYVASNGTGDGSSPSSPLGNEPGYKIEVGSDKRNAFYRGMEKLKNTGGTLVIVGEVFIDTASSRVPANKNELKAPSEFRSPDFRSGASLKVTSVYSGVDYRKQGAKLIFDHDNCNTAGFFFGCKTEVLDLNIEYRYDPDSKNSWGIPFLFGGYGNPLTIGANVNVTSYNVKTKSEGDWYPILLGGHRYSTDFTSTDLTVRSGTWSIVIAGSFGMLDSSKDYGTIKGNASLSVEGGKIETVIGTGSLKHPSGTVLGNLNISITGGEIGKFYVCNDYEFKGRNISVILGKNARISEFFYAPDSYYGKIEELVSKVKLTNNSSVNTSFKEEVPLAPETVFTPTATKKQKSPEKIKKNPNKHYDNILDMINDDEYRFIHPKIFLGVIVISVIIALGFAARHYLKIWRVKTK